MRSKSNGDTLTGVIERALRVYLTPPPARGTPFKLDLLTKKGKLVPGIDWDDRNALYDRAATGNLVVDAQIAALCEESGVSTLLTEDRDFARFPSVRAKGLDG